jgi:hypothetical protein
MRTEVGGIVGNENHIHKQRDTMRVNNIYEQIRQSLTWFYVKRRDEIASSLRRLMRFVLHAVCIVLGFCLVGWIAVNYLKEPPVNAETWRDHEMQALQIDGYCNGGYLATEVHCQIYNGNVNFTVTRLWIVVTEGYTGGETKETTYRMAVAIPSETAAAVNFKLAHELDPKHQFRVTRMAVSASD